MPFRLILRNILSHPLRSFLTFGSVFLAVFLLCILTATTNALNTSVNRTSTERLWVQSAVSLFVQLPENYNQKIRQVDGVEWTCPWNWFGGYYRDISNFFAQFACDVDTLQKSYPEMVVTEGSYEGFQQNRVGCIVGQGLADDFGWKIGDSVPITGTIYAKNDNSAWEFTVEGIYQSENSSTLDERTLYFHFDYLRETLEAGEADGADGVGVYMVKIADDANATQVMADIDALFQGGPQRVQTNTEGEFQRQFLDMLGNVPTLLSIIGAAVLFAIAFAVLNTMLMAARERTRDVGIMKALGFKDTTVAGMLVIESLILCGSAGLLALALAYGAQKGVADFLVTSGIPGYYVNPETAVFGIAIAVGLGLLAGLIPGLRVRSMSPVRALRAEA